MMSDRVSSTRVPRSVILTRACMIHNKRKHKRRPGRGRGRQPAFSRELLARAAEMVARGELMPLKNDAAFKMFLSAPTAESNACLRSMLSALTGRTVTTAKVTNAELLPEYAKGKKPRLDVNCEFNDGQKADIELQRRPPVSCPRDYPALAPFMRGGFSSVGPFRQGQRAACFPRT